MNITAESIQEMEHEAGHRRFPPSHWIDVRLGTGSASFSGEEVDIIVKQR